MSVIRSSKDIGTTLRGLRETKGISIAEMIHRIREIDPAQFALGEQELKDVEAGIIQLGARELGAICLVLDTNPLHVLMETAPTHLAPFRAATWPTLGRTQSHIQAAADDLAAGMCLGGSGVYIVLSDVPAVYVSHLDFALAQTSLERKPLFATYMQLNPHVRHPPLSGQVFVAIINVRVPTTHAQVRALNFESGHLTVTGNHTVLILPGYSREDCDDAYLAFTRMAPDLWAIRTTVHAVGTWGVWDGPK